MTDGRDKDDRTPEKNAASRRSVAIALLLGLMVLLFYAATIVRLGGNAINKAL